MRCQETRASEQTPSGEHNRGVSDTAWNMSFSMIQVRACEVRFLLWVGLEAFNQTLVTQSPVLAQVIRKIFGSSNNVHKN